MPEPVKDREAVYKGLNRRTFVVLLLLVLLLFVLLNPIYESQSTEAWDENIWWSYAPIPFLVPLALWFEKNLSWRTFSLETMQLVLVKFGITFLLSHTLWFLDGPPKSENIFASQQRAMTPEPLPYALSSIPKASPLSAEDTLNVQGRVLDGAGNPVSKVIVYIEKGLDDLIFAAPKAPLKMIHNGQGFYPALSFLQAYQELEVGSADSKLHTARLTLPGGRRLFNVPVLPTKHRRLMFSKTYGVTHLRSETDSRAGEATIVIVGHPFVSISNQHGSFAWENVPKRVLQLHAWHPKLGELHRTVAFDEGEEPRSVTLQFETLRDYSDQ
ncbi:MAG: hypothetical protein QGI45_05465 [Myxococcota bacterium]|jgi:hypothetical protein|nr:hypothetical protein [Myxococcota bacterium]